ncbi:halocyanin domain-containing protein [Halorussus litoreus]|uniref:halocyanin domain-containing protein n=1 Tax=Halorussus litoreus TaxID=1710536 RepID=UPI000E27A061|nr:halocyanin domain-containing protein [Halorussus litoreus]
MNTHSSRSDGAIARRTFLKGTAGLAGVAAVGAGASVPAAAQSPFGGWFDGVGNYDGVVDRRGESEVTVEVGAQGNGGNFAFGPAAVRIDPGTTVIWEWTGQGSMHNVSADDGSFESEMVGEAGHTFEQTFENEGVTKYVCTPHATMGMKGAIVVGDDAATDASDSSGSSGSGTTESTDSGSSETTDGDGSGAGDGSGSSGGAGGDANLESWFEGVSNYDGVVDHTGESEVTVSVGASGNDGNFAFGPAAVRVDPGTTVVWEWTGQGGNHNVSAQGGSFESEMVGEAGHTFEQTFEEEGVAKYVCTPHETMGMKGAVVVGSEAASDAPVAAASASGGRSTTDWLTLGFAGALVAGLLGLPIADQRSKQREA